MTFHCGFGIEANTGITYGETKGVGCSAKFYSEVRYAAVLDGVVQGFLRNPEKAKRNVLRDSLRYVHVDKVNLYVLLFRQFHAEPSDRINYSQMPKLRRVQLMRQRVNTCRYIEDLFTEFIYPIADFILRIGRNISQPF